MSSPRDRAAALEYIVSEAGMRGEWRAARAYLEEGLDWLRRSGARAYEAGQCLVGCWVYVSLGEFERAVALTEAGLSLLDAEAYEQATGTHGMNWKIVGLGYASWALAVLGYPERAMAMRRQALDLAGRLDSPMVKLGSLGVAGAAATLALRVWDTALEAIEAEQQLAEARGSSTFVATALAQRGRAELGLGQVPEAIAHLQDGIARLRAEGAEAYLTGYLVDLAAAYALAGQAARGLEGLTQAQDAMQHSDERFAESELHRVGGDLLLLLDPPDAVGAEAAFQEALAIARRQQARLYELRAAVALGRLGLSQGRIEETRALVQPVYDWFTEGFDLRDLVEARELLETLASKRPHIGLGTGNA